MSKEISTNSGTTNQASRKPAPNGYYTAHEASSKLGLAPSTFRKYVTEGYIPRYVPSKKSEGYYLSILINALIPLFLQRDEYTPRELRSRMASTRDRFVPPLSEHILTKKGVTDWISFDDLPFVQYLDIEQYGLENTVDMTVTSRWWEKNPFMCRILFNEEDRRDIWGALTIMPLEEALIVRLLKQEVSEREIRVEDIAVYEPGHVYSGYVASVVIRPQYQSYFRTLIQSVLEFWCDQYPSITLRSLYAYGVGTEGRRIIRHLFFSRRYDIGANAWELNPMDEDNPSRLITSFQRCVKQKVNKP